MDQSKRTTAVLLGLFVGSGCSALIYEIVWLQQLGLVLGATSVSLAILLTSFMGGMCIGSLALPKLVSASRHPLRVYAVLELLIGVCGLAILWAMPFVSSVYCSVALPGSGDLLARALVALTLLLPPTILMGATLPAVARWVRASRDGLSSLGFFYGANTFGAVLGSTQMRRRGKPSPPIEIEAEKDGLGEEREAFQRKGEADNWAGPGHESGPEQSELK